VSRHRSGHHRPLVRYRDRKASKLHRRTRQRDRCRCGDQILEDWAGGVGVISGVLTKRCRIRTFSPGPAIGMKGKIALDRETGRAA
jgi:hypothetical protein